MEKTFVNLPHDAQMHLLLHALQSCHVQLATLVAGQHAQFEVQQLILQKLGYTATESEEVVAEIVASKYQGFGKQLNFDFEKELNLIWKSYR